MCKCGKSAVLALSTVHIVESLNNEATSSTFSLYTHEADISACYMQYVVWTVTMYFVNIKFVCGIF